MKLPRNLNGDTLARALQKFDYQITRQTGSHLRLTTHRNGEHLRIICNLAVKNSFRNFLSNPRHILDLLKRIVQVSIETLKIVNELPPLQEH